MTHTRSAMLIGGGIAGPAAAIALQKAGIDSVIYEAQPTNAAGVGAFLTMASNGVDALRVIDVDTPALAVGFPTPTITLRSGSGKYLGESRTGRSLPDGATSQTVKRDDLYRVLHEDATRRGVRVEHGKRLVAATTTGDGVRAAFADGSEAVGDVLIGCDGVHSVVRRIIDPATPRPTYAGLLTTGGYTRGVPVGIEPGGFEMIFGRRGFFGYALSPAGEVWWFANVPRRDEPARGELDAVPADEVRRRLVELSEGDAGPAVELIRASRETVSLSPIHTIPRLPTWHNGRMVVIGDAAHAPSPTSGQGASLSIEDAVVLAQCLRDLPSSGAAFAAFEVARRHRVEQIARWAARVNNSKAAGPVAAAIRDVMLPKILKMTSNSKALRQTFDHHIDWDGPARPAV